MGIPALDWVPGKNTQLALKVPTQQLRKRPWPGDQYKEEASRQRGNANELYLRLKDLRSSKEMGNGRFY